MIFFRYLLAVLLCIPIGLIICYFGFDLKKKAPKLKSEKEVKSQTIKRKR